MNRAKKIMLVVAGVFFIAGLVFGEESAGPAYEVIERTEEFEVRKYEPYLVAEVEVKGSFSTAAFQAFQLLFEYIDGNNVSREDIAMTSPVTQEPSGEKIAMTAPVTQEPAGEKIAMTSPVTQEPRSAADGGDYVVGFVMPRGYTLETIPEPLDSRVKIREEPAKTVAVRTYTGSWSQWKYKKNEKALLKALEENGYTTVSSPMWARYDHPLTPLNQRQNEIMVEVKK